MAKNPKKLRKGISAKKQKAEKAIKIKQQQVKQAHRRIPNKVEKTTYEKVTSEKTLSPHVQSIRKKKEELRAEKAKAVMLKMLKDKRKRELQRIADERNQKKMEFEKSVYIESTLTKRRFKVPLRKANKYCKKWFVMSNKLAFKEQERLERKERKTIAANKLEKHTSKVPIYKTKMETVEVEHTYDKNHEFNRNKTFNKKGKDTYKKKETVTRPVLDEKGKPVQEKVGEREITIFGIPKEVFDGQSRKQRREALNRKQGGNRFLKRQIVPIKELKNPKTKEDYEFTYLKPELLYIKEEYEGYKKVEQEGKVTFEPTILERLKKVLKGHKLITVKGIRDVNEPFRPGKYKSFLTLALPKKKGLEQAKLKAQLEAMKKAHEEEQAKKDQTEKSIKDDESNKSRSKRSNTKSSKKGDK